MQGETDQRHYPVEEALKAQKALRQVAGLAPEMFPVPAFVGMISDEIESLRNLGTTDEEIVGLIHQHSSIEITEKDISQYFVPAEQRHPEKT
jgi:hypothetical protein